MVLSIFFEVTKLTGFTNSCFNFFSFNFYEVIEFSFNGFSVGLGAEFSIDWGNALIGLDVSALVLAGIGSNPLTVAAGVFVDGEVHFLLLSAGISGHLLFLYVEDDDGGVQRIEGRVCARIGLWGFKKAKCGNVLIGDEVSPVPPPPPAAARLELVTA